jgi:hypothetical protein
VKAGKKMARNGHKKGHLTVSFIFTQNITRAYRAFTNYVDKTRYSRLSKNREVKLTNFGKFYTAQNKNPPCTFIDFITKLSIFFQNLIQIFLTVILSYKSLF